MFANISLFVIAIVFLAATIVYIARGIGYEDKDDASHAKTCYRKIPLTVIGAIVAFALALSITIIPSGKTGVLTTLGQVNPNVLSNGVHFIRPIIDSVELVNNKQQDISSDYEVWSETSSRTALYYSDITVTLTIESAESAWIISNVENYKQTLVSGALIDSAVKTSSKLLNDTDATNRAIIEPLVAETLQASLDQKYGRRAVTINKVTIGEVDFEKSYNLAIAEKQNAQLAYEQQAIENKTAVEKAQAEADAKLIAAQADAEARKIAAQAEAESLKITAEAEAAANRKILESLTEVIIRYNTIEKWDGKLPAVMGQNDTILDIAGLFEETQ